MSIYVSTRQGEQWSPPEPISFSGPHKDYQPTLSPDGSVMLFNSWRPMPDGTPVTNEKNNLWISRSDERGQWTEPVLLDGALAPGGRVYYLQETLDEHGELLEAVRRYQERPDDRFDRSAPLNVNDPTSRTRR